MKKQPKKSFWSPNPKNFKNALIAFLVVTGIFFVLHRLTELGRNVQQLTFSTFLEKVEKKAIKKVYVSGQDVEGLLTDGTRFETVISNNFNDWEKLRSHGVEFSVLSPSSQLSVWYIFLFSCLLTIIWAVWYFFKQKGNSNNGGGGNIFTMEKVVPACFYHQALRKTLTL